MKYLLLISAVLLAAGILLKDEYFTLNIHDTYFITSYLYIAILLVILLNLIFLINYLLKKSRTEMNKALLFILFLIPCWGNSQDISGNWRWDSPDGKAQVELQLQQNGDKITGYHCCVFHNGEHIDCISEENQSSLDLTRTSIGIFKGSIKSGYSNTSGKVELHFDQKLGLLLFQLTEAPSGIYFLPKEMALEGKFKPRINLVTREEYAQIKFDGVLLKNLMMYKGELAGISALFQKPFDAVITDPDVRTFKNDDFLLAYGNVIENRRLYWLELLTPNSSMELKGKTVRIGNPVSVLGFGEDLVSFVVEGDSQLAVFAPFYESSSVGVEFDAETGIITRIYFLEPT
jgi:hypothetical protein